MKTKPPRPDVPALLDEVLQPDELAPGHVLELIMRYMGGVAEFAREIAHEFKDAPAGSTTRARLGNTLLQALLKHHDPDDDEDLGDLAAEEAALARAYASEADHDS